MSLDKYERFLTITETKHQTLKDRRKEILRELWKLKTFRFEWLEARHILNSAMLATQMKLKAFVEDTVSLCLQAIYGDGYEFEIEYEVKRNKSEANFRLVKDGVKHSLKDEVGGGVLDVVDFGLRMSCWALDNPRTSAFFILDEKFKFVSKDLSHKIGDMLQKLSEVHDIQFLLVTHDKNLLQSADRAWEVTQEKGISHVERI